MKLHSLLKEDHILVHCEAAKLEDILRLLVTSLEDELGEVDVEDVVRRIVERERLRPTFKNGIVYPHLRGAEFPDVVLAMAIPENPVPYPKPEQSHAESDNGAVSGVETLEPTVTYGEDDEDEAGDNANVGMVCLVVGPYEQNSMMLQTLAALRRLTSPKSFAKSIKKVKSPSRLIRLVEESGLDVKQTLTAKDIMEPVETILRLDTPLTEAADALAKAPDEGLPVVDDRGHMTGELTTREFLQFGMPKYMELLTNPEMLNAFEPFENYFVNEHKAKVRDICRRDVMSVPPEAPIVRVAHLMITKNRRRIYVQEEDRILGVIFRKSILTRVMNQ